MKDVDEVFRRQVDSMRTCKLCEESYNMNYADWGVLEVHVLRHEVDELLLTKKSTTK